jgi:hypothetical protein
MTTLRLHVLLGTALIATAGWAQPARADQSAPAAVSAAPVTSAAATASMQRMISAIPRPLLVFAYDQGWRQVVMVGKKGYFCRSDVPSGTLIPLSRCVTPSQLQFMRLTVEQQQQQLRKPIPSDRMG